MRSMFFAAAAAALVAAPATAQDWEPTGTVSIIAPASPGGGYDGDARRLQKVLDESEIVDVPVNVINRPGGGSTIGWNSLNQGEADGHTIAVSSTTLLTTDIVGTNPLQYTDFTPIAIMANGYLVFAVQDGSNFEAPQDLIDALKADPTSVRFAASPGPGNANHILISMLARSIGVDVAKLPIAFFGSAGEVAVALLGGHVDVAVGSIPPFMQHVDAGNMRILAVGAPKRLPGKLADVPTWKENGVDAVFLNWRGIIGPKDMTPEQVAFWEKALEEVSQDPEWVAGNERSYNVVEFVAKPAGMLAEQYSAVRDVMEELGLAKQ